MESIGLPCYHIVAVLVYLDFYELPKSVVLDRWTKTAKDGICATNDDGSGYWNSQYVVRHAALVHLSKELCDLAHRDIQDYNELVDYLTSEVTRLGLKYAHVAEQAQQAEPANNGQHSHVESIQDPPIVRTKGCGKSNAAGRQRRTQTCGNCGAVGHNRRSCPGVRQSDNGGGAPTAPSTNAGGTNDSYNTQLPPQTNNSLQSASVVCS